MTPRFTSALIALAATGAVAIPTVAQARGGNDDPANHEQLEHQAKHHRSGSDNRHDRLERRHHHREQRGEGADDGANHR